MDIKLYHYCSLQTAVEYILPSMKLKLGPIINTNDPRENKDLVFAASYNWDQNINNHDLNVKRFCNILRDDCKLICFSTNKELFGWELSRMWAMYGNKHKGICLEIDKEQFINENPFLKKDRVKFQNINYVDSIPKKFIGHPEIDYTELKQYGETIYLRKRFRQRYFSELYLTKTKEWKSEQEFRLIYFSNSDKDEYCSIKSSLNRILLGVDFNMVYYPSITKLSNIKIDKLKYGDGRLQCLKTYKR